MNHMHIFSAVARCSIYIYNQVQHALAKHVLSFYVSPLTSVLPVYDQRKEDITSFYLLHCKTGEPKCVVL